jgi:hypothetical protein
MNLTIRKADIEDAAAIAHVHVESWKTTYAGIVSDVFLASLNKEVRTQSWQEQILAANISILVAEDKTNIRLCGWREDPGKARRLRCRALCYLPAA